MRNLPIMISVILVGLIVPSYVNGAILFQDDFDDSHADGWKEYNGSFSVLDGSYRLESTEWGQDTSAVIGDLEWTDYTIEVDFKVVRSDDSFAHHPSILFHVQDIGSGTDIGHYYQLYMFPTRGVGFSEISGGSAPSPILVDCPLPRGVWHHVRLEVEGTTATAYIDGAYVLSYNKFTRYRSGMIGLKTINDGVVLFDNIVVAPEPATVLLLGLGSLMFLRKRSRTSNCPSQRRHIR
jgi:hypothetical protein